MFKFTKGAVTRVSKIEIKNRENKTLKCIHNKEQI